MNSESWEIQSKEYVEGSLETFIASLYTVRAIEAHA